jgi:putative tricarboxylic transport membrane protein
MKRFDRVGAVICLVFSALVIWQSGSVPRGDISQPGPGFMPFWVAVILAILSAFLWVESGLRKNSPDEVRFLSGEGRWRSVVLTGGSLLGYAFLIETLGFLLSTFVLLLFLFRFIGNQKWWVVLTGSSVVTLVTHLLFRVALKVQLPRGPF